LALSTEKYKTIRKLQRNTGRWKELQLLKKYTPAFYVIDPASQKVFLAAEPGRVVLFPN
jgi:hypothetical protein